jgi:hypothetical protein
MHNLNSTGSGSTSGTNARLIGKPVSRRDGAAGHSFRLMERVVRQDYLDRGEPPDLTTDDVLAWADAFFERTGDWPTHRSGPIPEEPGETWRLVAGALAFGLRGFSRGGSIPRFLYEHRGQCNSHDQKFTEKQILAWADAWYARTGYWPNQNSGHIPGSHGLTWVVVERALKVGRGLLPGGSSLTQLLIQHRGIRSATYAPPLEVPQILAWADAFQARNGRWPLSTSGPVAEASGLTWHAINCALSSGGRRLPGRSSLSRLLAQERGVRRGKVPRPITVPQILQWADAYKERHGTWPDQTSGPIPEAPDESWNMVNAHLKAGRRGLPAGSSVSRLLVEHRGRRHRRHLPDLTIPQILDWIHAFHARTGRWPAERSGAIPEFPGETWSAVDRALSKGKRGLSGGVSLSGFLKQHAATLGTSTPPIEFSA